MQMEIQNALNLLLVVEEELSHFCTPHKPFAHTCALYFKTRKHWSVLHHF